MSIASEFKAFALRGNVMDLAVGVIVGTAIRVWAGMDVIQTQIQALVKSDNQQNERIEQVRTEVNNLRVQVGVLRALGERK